MNALPTVSVIVPVYNDAQRLALCLDALAAQDYPSELMDIVVIDNASTDRPERVVTGRARVQLVTEDRPGSYAARNAGLAVAAGEVLAFTDSDCIPDPRWLREAVAALRLLPAPGRVGGRVEVFARDSQRMSAVEAYDTLHAFPQSRYVGLGFAATANLVADARVLTSVGMFDAELRSGGDRRWGERATAVGIPLTYADRAVVRHPARRSWAQLRDKLRRVTAGARDARALGGTPPRSGRIRALLPPVSAVRRAMEDPRLPDHRARFGFVAVCFFVKYVRTYERFRLYRGGESPR